MRILELLIGKRRKTVRIDSSLEGRIFEIAVAVLIIGLWVLVAIMSDRADKHPEMVRWAASVSDYIANYKLDLRFLAGLGTIAPILVCIGAYFPSAMNLAVDIEPVHYGMVSRMLRIIAVEFVLMIASLMLLIPCFGFSIAKYVSVALLAIMFLTYVCFNVLISRKG